MSKRTDALQFSLQRGRKCFCHHGPDGEFTGRIFGGWANCPHGIRGRLAELEQERERLLEDLADMEILLQETDRPVVTIEADPKLMTSDDRWA